MRLDLHTHSRYSPDSKLDPIEIVKAAKQRGFDGVAITDHNAVEGSRLAWEYGRANGFLVIRGAEISTDVGHVLAYGTTVPIARGRRATASMGKAPRRTQRSRGCSLSLVGRAGRHRSGTAARLR